MNLNQIRENLSESLNQLQGQNFSMAGMIDELSPLRNDMQQPIAEKSSPGKGLVDEIGLLAREIQINLNIMRQNQENLRSIIYGEDVNHITASSLQKSGSLENMMKGSYM